MFGLIIKKEWLDLILKGEKNLEIRGSNTNHTGETIALIESGSGLIRGTCQLTGTFPLFSNNYEASKNIWNQTRNRHCVPISYEKLLTRYKKPYAWHFMDVQAYDEPVPYKHPQGAVIWVNLDKEGVVKNN